MLENFCPLTIIKSIAWGPQAKMLLQEKRRESQASPGNLGTVSQMDEWMENSLTDLSHPQISKEF